ncbi:hypothetical protein B9Z55_014781 [Caenorhabditis nigoni]|uniref:60S ribosomal protein L29 n=1 Tax=Caenorhabditis nigoni TaxID=1611254 RepID=A0A2G5U796_9PELO|nr:hypothetical protein B9Z55_014781 [Caenorhabditis nigoni]
MLYFPACVKQNALSSAAAARRVPTIQGKDYDKREKKVHRNGRKKSKKHVFLFVKSVGATLLKNHRFARKSKNAEEEESKHREHVGFNRCASCRNCCPKSQSFSRKSGKVKVLK